MTQAGKRIDDVFARGIAFEVERTAGEFEEVRWVFLGALFPGGAVHPGIWSVPFEKPASIFGCGEP